MIIPKLALTLAINGDSRSLAVVDNPSGWATERILWIISPLRLPSWSIYFRSSHTRRLTLQHLLLKHLLEGLNKNERVVMLNLTVAQPDLEYDILEIILTNNFTKTSSKSAVLQELVQHNFLGITDPLRQYASFSPKMSIFKVWTEMKRIPPKQVIGVGYNDHGTLSSVPSWKDQMTDDGEEHSRLLVLAFSLRKILEISPVSDSSFLRSNIRLTSSNRAKQGRK